jgi:polyphosphate kinase 2 (PPK2 family)
VPPVLTKVAERAQRDYVYEHALGQLQARARWQHPAARTSRLIHAPPHCPARCPQIELVKLQETIKAKGLKVAVLFEGRDAAGKGGCISRIASAMSPRVCRVVALSAPTDKEKSQWYFQRYVPHLPSAGELVLFDRSCVCSAPVGTRVAHPPADAPAAVHVRAQLVQPRGRGARDGLLHRRAVRDVHEGGACL